MYPLVGNSSNCKLIHNKKCTVKLPEFKDEQNCMGVLLEKDRLWRILYILKVNADGLANTSIYLL